MIAIIGAGPVGSWTAYNLAKAGKEVTLFEDHEVIGSPVQCTGVLTSTITEILPPKKEYFANEISRIEAIAPDNTSVELKLKKKEHIYHRTRFDQYLAGMARDAGAKVLTSHRFLDYSPGLGKIRLRTGGKIVEYNAERVIGCDGPSSQVAKSAGLYGKREFFVGAQALVKLKNDPELYKTYFGSVCPGLFAWAVPEDENHVRLGLADRKNPHALFQLLMKRVGAKKIVEQQGGLIPIYNPKLRTMSWDGKVMLVGDAATQVKATTAGGIIQGMTAGQIAAGCILENRNYEKEWRKTLSRELWLHLELRKLLDKFSDKDYNRLIGSMKKKSVKKVLEHESRDRPISLLWKLFLAEPGL